MLQTFSFHLFKTGPELQVWIEELPDDIAPMALFGVH